MLQLSCPLAGGGNVADSGHTEWQPAASQLTIGWPYFLKAFHLAISLLRWLVACIVVVFYFAGTIMTKLNVQPTYVLFSPYACQNNKKVEFVAKHGSLFFAVIFVICMILFHLNSKDNLWVVFLPLFLFHGVTYVIGCFSSSKTFQFIQILFTSVLVPFNFHLLYFERKNFTLDYGLEHLIEFSSFATLIYPIILHTVYRKHYVKDLSTAESVSTLNTIDFLQAIMFIACILASGTLTYLLQLLFPFYVYRNPNPQEILTSNSSWVENVITSFVFTYLTCFVVSTYLFVIYCNRSKSMANACNVEIDSDGRAWFSVFHQFAMAFSTLKKCCALRICHWCTNLHKSTGWNQSSVKPEESQKLPLKQLADMNV
uniref:Transmembrane protein n=1 Tax=Panagrellus redivivus TaxID=6233 RepID=A0A7E4W5M5_PANRE